MQQGNRHWTRGSLSCHSEAGGLRAWYRRCPMHVEVKSRSAFGPEDRAALEALSAAVYPPEVIATSPGRDVTWAPPQHSIFVHDDAGHLVAHVGVVTREVTLDGTVVRVGGIGGVSTHPDYRSRGYAAAGIQRAVDFFIEDPSIAFALLVCQRNVAPYYARTRLAAVRGRPHGGTAERTSPVHRQHADGVSHPCRGPEEWRDRSMRRSLVTIFFTLYNVANVTKLWP